MLPEISLQNKVGRRHKAGKHGQQRPFDMPLQTHLRIDDGKQIYYKNTAVRGADNGYRQRHARPILQRHGNTQQHEQRHAVDDPGGPNEGQRMKDGASIVQIRLP